MFTDGLKCLKKVKIVFQDENRPGRPTMASIAEMVDSVTFEESPEGKAYKIGHDALSCSKFSCHLASQSIDPQSTKP